MAQYSAVAYDKDAAWSVGLWSCLPKCG